MKRAFASSMLAVIAVLLIAVGCGSSGDLSKAETQRQFGVRMARMNLWREAMFRFKRAVEIEPSNAMAHNNLAVAYEATGDFDSAAKEYREALRLDRSNQHIQKNYSRFVEFTSRSKKRQPARPASTTTAMTAAADTSSTTVSATTTAPAAVPPPPATATAPPLPPTADPQPASATTTQSPQPPPPPPLSNEDFYR
ncbi:MAG TPA: tetratricopeptide repeat protein [Thermoanaerobaculia bacterium]|nr:tetratricopeptide repeat protein [Thermoanaerobaculia bacterium]